MKAQIRGRYQVLGKIESVSLDGMVYQHRKLEATCLHHTLRSLITVSEYTWQHLESSASAAVACQVIIYEIHLMR